jgi:hypothetical protein
MTYIKCIQVIYNFYIYIKQLIEFNKTNYREALLMN